MNEYKTFEEWFKSEYPVGFDSPIIKAVAKKSWEKLQNQVLYILLMAEYKDGSGNIDGKYAVGAIRKL